MQIYLVGGAVRDQLLGYPVYDRDWVVVGATPQQMLDKGFTPVGSDFPVFIHPISHEEYALARTERKSGKGYKGFQYHASPDVTLEQDLIRRDLTINAMAQADDGTLVDPYNGQQDLANKKLRHVSPAFSEDPLRVLRVARFAARYAHLGFEVADETIALMQQLACTDELSHLTAERVWKELERALAEPSPEVFIQVLALSQAFEALFSDLSAILSVDTEQLKQTLAAVSQSTVRFAILQTLAHQGQPAEQAQQQIKASCARLKAPNQYRDLALHCQQWGQALAQLGQVDGQQRLQLIRALDLIKRPERLNDLCECSAALHGDSANKFSEQLPDLLAQLRQLNPQELIAAGFQGKALGEELARQQQKICQAFTFQ